MSRISHITISILTFVFLNLGLATIANAADRNTYRPGQAYLKTAAQSHQVCAQQCQGDAQCRGWNFVRPNPRSATGICEFNARVALPVRSAISISGEISTSVDPLMSRAIPAGTNTRRVGTPTISTRKPAAGAPQPTQVRRMPVPAPQKDVQPTALTKPAFNTPSVRQPRIYGKPEARTTPIGQTRQNPALTPQQQQYRQQFLAERQRQQQLKAQQQSAMRQQQYQRPQLMRQPVSAPAPYGPQIAQQQMPVPAGVQPPQSLFGSLHDDLTKDFTPVPRPQTAPDNLNNADAPIATSRAKPTAPVETAPLKQPVIPGLAGAEQ